ncbi:hypothetical protein OPQ81_009126 [Rhizoctonia solani]|nr:hypothetical protein OPQ81_009126 [Rhizoctonia solani]
MSGSHCLSSPIKWGCPPVETRKPTEAYSDISQFGVLQDVDNQPFVNAYLSGCSLESKPWPPNEATLVESIIQTRKGQEQTIYAPLLQLLNCTSQRVFQRINAKREALVFYSRDRCNITNTFTPQERHPDIVGVWVETPTHTFPQTNYDSTILARGGTWCELAVVGEAKVQAHGKHQLASYLQSHLQLHPELNAVLGFGFKSSGYTLFYHDAGTIHRSQFSWKQPGPLNSCIEKLYTRPFQDPSMRILDPKRLIWAVKVGDDVYLSETPEL